MFVLKANAVTAYSCTSPSSTLMIIIGQLPGRLPINLHCLRADTIYLTTTINLNAPLAPSTLGHLFWKFFYEQDDSRRQTICVSWLLLSDEVGYLPHVCTVKYAFI